MADRHSGQPGLLEGVFEMNGDAQLLIGRRARRRRNSVPPLLAVLGLGRRLGRRRSSKGDGGRAQNQAAQEEVLPVSLRRGNRLEKYVWDGSQIVAVSEEWLRTHKNRHGTVAEKLTRLRDGLAGAFFPKASEVTPDYWEYTKWRAMHRVCSAMLQNFATQSLLAAVGVGAQRQLPTAAAINWVLKDGLGRLGRLSVATGFGQSFDSDLKRFRMTTSLLFSAAITLEYLTPLFPSHFLLLASAANVGKSMGLATYIATTPAFQRSFAKNENLADLNAKGQAQSMVMDTLGLASCVALTWAVRNHPRAKFALPLVVLPVCGLGDLTAIYAELKSVHLRIMNRERAELICEDWLGSGRIPSAQQVSGRESLLLPTPVAQGLLPLRIQALHEVVDSPGALSALLQRHRGEKYMLAYREAPDRGLRGVLSRGRVRGRLALSLRDDADAPDMLAGVLQAAYFRRLMSASLRPSPSTIHPPEGSHAHAAQSAPADSLGSTPGGASLDRAADSAGASSSASSAGTEGHSGGWRSLFGVRQLSAGKQNRAGARQCSSCDDGQGQQRLREERTSGPQLQVAGYDAELVERALRGSHSLARAGVATLMEQMQAREWQTHPFMLSSVERTSYCITG